VLIVYDTETTELAGHPAIGLSVACVWRSTLDRYDFYSQRRIVELLSLLNAGSLIAGFCNTTFDNPLLTRLSGRRLTAQVYDLYAEIVRVVGRGRAGWSLAAISRAMLPVHQHKTGDGAEAPGLFRRGELDKLYSYALGDVQTTVAVLRAVVLAGGVVSNGTDKIRVNVARIAPYFRRQMT